MFSAQKPISQNTRKHFILLLYTAIMITLFFSIYDMVQGLLLKAAMEVAMLVCYVIAVQLVSHNRFVRPLIYIVLVFSLSSVLFNMLQYPTTAYWPPLIAVLGFGFLGKKEGEYWAIFSIVCTILVLSYDLTSMQPLYNLGIAMNIILSSALISFIVYVSYYQLERKQEQLIKEVGEREKLELSKRISSNIAHLINNEMQVILGESEMEMLQNQGGEKNKRLNRILLSAESASKHANQLVAFSQSSVGGKQPFNLYELFNKLFQTWKESLPEHVSVALNCSTDKVQCVGDVQQLKLLFLGILENAREAIDCHLEKQKSGQGHVAVTLSDETLDEACDIRGLKAGCYLLVCIEDNGCGIPEAIQEKIFEPYISTGFMGRGMGLAAAFGAVKNHQGHIEAGKAQEQGSVFKVWLPTAV